MTALSTVTNNGPLGTVQSITSATVTGTGNGILVNLSFKELGRYNYYQSLLTLDIVSKIHTQIAYWLPGKEILALR